MGLAPGFKLHTCLSLPFMSAKAWRATLGLWPAPEEKAEKIKPRAQVSCWRRHRFASGRGRFKAR